MLLVEKDILLCSLHLQMRWYTKQKLPFTCCQFILFTYFQADPMADDIPYFIKLARSTLGTSVNKSVPYREFLRLYTWVHFCKFTSSFCLGKTTKRTSNSRLGKQIGTMAVKHSATTIKSLDSTVTQSIVVIWTESHTSSTQSRTLGNSSTSVFNLASLGVDSSADAHNYLSFAWIYKLFALITFIQTSAADPSFTFPYWHNSKHLMPT